MDVRLFMIVSIFIVSILIIFPIGIRSLDSALVKSNVFASVIILPVVPMDKFVIRVGSGIIRSVNPAKITFDNLPFTSTIIPLPSEILKVPEVTPIDKIRRKSPKIINFNKS